MALVTRGAQFEAPLMNQPIAATVDLRPLQAVQLNMGRVDSGAGEYLGGLQAGAALAKPLQAVAAQIGEEFDPLAKAKKKVALAQAAEMEKYYTDPSIDIDGKQMTMAEADRLSESLKKKEEIPLIKARAQYYAGGGRVGTSLANKLDTESPLQGGSVGEDEVYKTEQEKADAEDDSLALKALTSGQVSVSPTGQFSVGVKAQGGGKAPAQKQYGIYNDNTGTAIIRDYRGRQVGMAVTPDFIESQRQNGFLPKSSVGMDEKGRTVISGWMLDPTLKQPGNAGLVEKYATMRATDDAVADTEKFAAGLQNEFGIGNALLQEGAKSSAIGEKGLFGRAINTVIGSASQQVANPKMLDLSGRLQAMQAELRHGLFGASLTQNELAQVINAMPTGQEGDYKTFQSRMNNFKRLYQEKKAKMERQFPTLARNEKERAPDKTEVGGNKRIDETNNVVSAPAGKRKVKAPNGQTYWFDEDKVEGALQAGGTLVE